MIKKGHIAWNKNIPHSEETKRKISKSLKGRKYSEEYKRKMSKALKGRKFSEETRKKLSIASKGRKFSDETKHKISETKKGKLLSEEHKRKISETLKGHLAWNKGIPSSEETRHKLSESRKGAKNHNWRGGISFLPYPMDWSDNLKESIRQRNSYICQLCGIHQDELKERLKQLDIHHIDYNKDNLDPDNLIALCRPCHTKTNYNRNHWIEYLSKGAK